MTDKERLEEIKVMLKGHEAELPNVMWLIKQAERVQELEEQKLSLIEEMGQVDERFLDLEQQNKKFREALEFYANEDNHEGFHKDDVDFEPKIFWDNGNLARKASEESK